MPLPAAAAVFFYFFIAAAAAVGKTPLDDRDLKPKRRNKFRSSGLLQATRESWEIRLGPQNTGPNEIGNQAGSAAACPHEALPPDPALVALSVIPFISWGACLGQRP